MFIRPQSRTGHHRIARALAGLLLLGAVSSGCDSITGGGDGGSILGTWMASESGYTVYLSIGSSTVTSYEGLTDRCFTRETFEVVTRSGDTYTLRQAGQDFTFDVIFRREGDGVRVLDPALPGDTGRLYRATEQDPATLERCPEGGGGGDPSIDCTALPPVALGQMMTGSITTTDAVGPDGRRYDLYGLELAVGGEVWIELDSGGFDPYLYVYAADGTLIAEDDDSGEGFNAALILTLDPGCYRIEATTFSIAQLGSYTLRVN